MRTIRITPNFHLLQQVNRCLGVPFFGGLFAL